MSVLSLCVSPLANWFLWTTGDCTPVALNTPMWPSMYKCCWSELTTETLRRPGCLGRGLRPGALAFETIAKHCVGFAVQLTSACPKRNTILASCMARAKVYLKTMQKR